MISFEILEAGYCTHPEFIVSKKFSLKSKQFPATVVLIRHPRYGNILFDTGYSEHFYDATSTFPEKIYSWVTPVHLKKENTAAFQLRNKNIYPEDINIIIISHFHADHIAGLRDFPRAKFYFLDRAYQSVVSLNRFMRVKNGFLKDLLPDDFEKRSHIIDSSNKIIEELKDFTQYDLLGDGSLIGVSLPGHTEGHLGLWISQNKSPYFFISDACWVREQFMSNLKVHFISKLIINNFKDYQQTIHKIDKIYLQHKEINIVPCHCQSTLDSLKV